MSGIEIAGLVLGTFPVLIQALEKYRSGADRLDDWWHFKSAYIKCEQELKYHHLLLEGTLRQLLSSLVVDDIERDNLISNPEVERWAGEELETRLKQHLPKAYDVILGIMVEICECVESLKKNFGLSNPATKVTIDQHHKLVEGKMPRSYLFSLEHFNFQSTRFRFALKRTSRDRLFAQLQNKNTQLRSLLQSTDDVMLARKHNNITKDAVTAEEKALDYSKHVTCFYEAVSKVWKTPHCGCASHSVNLQLREAPDPSSNVLNVLFNMALNDARYNWRHTRIHSLSQKPSNRQTQQNRVGRAAVGHGMVTRTAQNQETPITNLCSSLASSNSPRTCIGFVENGHHRFSIYPHTQLSSPAFGSGVTLRTLIRTMDAGYFTRKKRYSLALALSKWLLQLGSTPWLGSQIDDIFVFLHIPSRHDALDFEHLYLRRSLSDTVEPSFREILRNFGTCLLELCFGVPLESTDFHKQMLVVFGPKNTSLDDAVAMMWSDTVGEEAGPEFQGAVKWCLRAHYIEEDRWRKEMERFVVEPLRLCHQSLLS